MILEYVLRNKIKKNNKNNNKTKVLGNKMRKIQRSRNSQQNWIMQINEYKAIEIFHWI